MRCCPPLCRQSVTLLLGLEKIFVNIVNFNFPVTGHWSPAPVSASTLTLTTDSSRAVNEKRSFTVHYRAFSLMKSSTSDFTIRNLIKHFHSLTVSESFARVRCQL